MSTQIKDLMYFEEKHTEYIRNSKTFEIVSDEKCVYVITEKDGEYGYKIFRGVAYTIDDALRFCCQKLLQTGNSFPTKYIYDKWLLVEGDDDRSDFWDWNLEIDSLDNQYTNTDYWISFYNSDGEMVDSVNLFAIRTYIIRTGVGEQY